MFRFFRAIRRGLLEQGKLKRYTGYALGEIVLVVAGILIALQINNANEARLEREREMRGVAVGLIDQIDRELEDRIE